MLTVPCAGDAGRLCGMATKKQLRREREFAELLRRDHTLNGGMLYGLDGFIVEIQARATEVLSAPEPVAGATRISGMPTGAVREVLDRIHGAFAKIGIPKSEVEILINLAPPDLPKAPRKNNLSKLVLPVFGVSGIVDACKMRPRSNGFDKSIWHWSR